MSQTEHPHGRAMGAWTILAQVARIAPKLHTAGTFSETTLRAIVRHASARVVEHSAETGSGASTLLFSHLSNDHTVFALDRGTNSVRAIEVSPLLRREVVTFVEGPTQRTLPRHTFAHRLQLALIDGPHVYPAPDLEYYYFYPHLDRDALLILDDIHIPTITNLFDFLRADDMFELQEVVETTAFFRRTSARTLSPLEGGWMAQGYNRWPFECRPAQVVQGEPLESVELPTPAYIDQLGGVADPSRVPRITVAQGEDLVVSGWAFDAPRRRPAEVVDLVLDGVSYRTDIRVPRADVATAHGDWGYFRSGFNTRLPGQAVPRGSHELELRVVLGRRQYVSAGRIRFEAV